MRPILCILALAVALAAAPAPAAADPAPRATAPKRTGVPHAPRRKVPIRTYSFTGDALDGSRVRPDGSTLFGLRGARHSSLIELRGDFLREMARTAERVP